MELQIDQKALEQQIIDQAVAEITESVLNGHDFDARLTDVMERKTREHCDAVVEPIIESGIKEFIIAHTNRHGEKTGEPTTFTEYLVGIAERYLMQTVDYEGKPTKKGDFAYKSNQTRLTHAIQKRLHYRVEDAMKDAVKQVHETIGPAIAKTVELQVKQVVTDLTRKRR